MGFLKAERLRPLILFSATFAICSFAFSFLSWERVALGPPGTAFSNVSTDLAEHAAFGALAALPSRRKMIVLIAALCAMLIDVDHIGSVIGLPVDGRASHALLFAVLASIVVFLLARKGLFGPEISTVMASVLVVAVVTAHLAWDALSGDGSFPLLEPLTSRIFRVPVYGGALLEVAAFALIRVASAKWDRGNQEKNGHSY